VITEKISIWVLQLAKSVFCFIAVLMVLFSFIHYSGAAVASNGQYGACGPYYLWYQTGPVSYQEYLDVCGITFDISDIIDDFDFVYFEDTEAFHRVSLDRNQDGYSDWSFFRRYGNRLEWRPQSGCARIRQQGCEQNTFNPACGYAMISVQPRRDSQNGSAVIPITVIAKCPPNNIDCSRTLVLRHTYSNCVASPVPNFVLFKELNTDSAIPDEEEVTYTTTILNTGGKTGRTILTTTISDGTNGGSLTLSSYNIECPPEAKCTVPSMTGKRIEISLAHFPADKQAKVIHVLKASTQGIPFEEGEKWSSDFTITSTLSTGGRYSAHVTVTMEY